MATRPKCAFILCRKIEGFLRIPGRAPSSGAGRTRQERKPQRRPALILHENEDLLEPGRNGPGDRKTPCFGSLSRRGLGAGAKKKQRETEGRPSHACSETAPVLLPLGPPNLTEMQKTGLFLSVLEPEEKVACAQKACEKKLLKARLKKSAKSIEKSLFSALRAPRNASKS